jgi:CO/xanthine dehydrogenase Mo-binding subunit
VSVVCTAEVTPNGDIRLRRIMAALDCGQAVNPDSVRAQIGGGLVFGMTAALYDEITLDKGRVRKQGDGPIEKTPRRRIEQSPHLVVSSAAIPVGR